MKQGLYVMPLLVCVVTSGCASFRAPPVKVEPPQPLMVVQNIDGEFIYCPTNKCPKPTVKTIQMDILPIRLAQSEQPLVQISPPPVEKEAKPSSAETTKRMLIRINIKGTGISSHSKDKLKIIAEREPTKVVLYATSVGLSKQGFKKYADSLRKKGIEVSEKANELIGGRDVVVEYTSSKPE